MGVGDLDANTALSKATSIYIVEIFSSFCCGGRNKSEGCIPQSFLLNGHILAKGFIRWLYKEQVVPLVSRRGQRS